MLAALHLLTEQRGGAPAKRELTRLVQLIDRLSRSLGHMDLSEEGANDLTQEQSAEASDAELEAMHVVAEAVSLGLLKERA